MYAPINVQFDNKIQFTMALCLINHTVLHSQHGAPSQKLDFGDQNDKVPDLDYVITSCTASNYGQYFNIYDQSHSVKNDHIKLEPNR